MALSPTLQGMTPLSDEELVSRVLEGDTVVFELLMRRHNQRLFRLARAVVGTADEAEDVVQEAYVRAYANLARFEGRSSLGTWLSRITFHEALRRRRRSRRARIAQGIDPDLGRSGEAEPATDNAVRAEVSALLSCAMDALPEGHRAVVMLRLVEGLGTRETAACLRLSETNVKVSLHRARKMLAESVERRMIPELRNQYRFDGARCDRIVATVFESLGVRVCP